MARTLKQMLENFLKDFDAYKINEYFAMEFAEDFDVFLANGEPENVLQYLNDEFFEIDVDYNSSKKMDEKVRQTLTKALMMIKF